MKLYYRMMAATSALLGDESLEAQTLLSLLIDVNVVGPVLFDLVDMAEQYLAVRV